MNNITDEGVNELCGALSDDKSHCEVIDLRSNAFGSLAAQKLGVALGTNIYVQELFLSHNDIGGEGAAALCASLAPTNAGFSAISVLDLRHCGIDDAGAERLGKSLVGNTALKTVSFCGNRIGDRGGGYWRGAAERAVHDKEHEFEQQHDWRGEPRAKRATSEPCGRRV